MSQANKMPKVKNFTLRLVPTSSHKMAHKEKLNQGREEIAIG